MFSFWFSKASVNLWKTFKNSKNVTWWNKTDTKFIKPKSLDFFKEKMLNPCHFLKLFTFYFCWKFKAIILTPIIFQMSWHNRLCYFLWMHYHFKIFCLHFSISPFVFVPLSADDMYICPSTYANTSYATFVILILMSVFNTRITFYMISNVFHSYFCLFAEYFSLLRFEFVAIAVVSFLVHCQVYLAVTLIKHFMMHIFEF